MGIRQSISRASSYLRAEIAENLSTGRRPRTVRRRRALRVGVLAARGFLKDGALHHASALSFDTVLALVPMLAIFFATLKGLGAYREFVDRTVRPWIDATFGPGGSDQVGLREAFVQILAFGEQTELAPLGFLGLLFVLYLVLLLLNTVETVFNHIWGVQRPRSLPRKMADYAALLFVAPFGLFLVTAVARWEASIHWLGSTTHDVVVHLLAILVSSAIFAFMYLVVPHARTRVGSALLGGLIAGAGSYGLLQLYAVTQIGVIRYNALYSGFAAIPLFLVWVFVTWLIVLFGAEITAAHHNQTGFRWRVQHHAASPSLQRFLAVRLTTLILRTYVQGHPPLSLARLAQRAGVPEEVAADVLALLSDRGYLVSAVHRGKRVHVPGRDLAKLRVMEIAAVVSAGPEDDAFAPDSSDEEGCAVAGLLGELDRVASRAEANVELRELVEGGARSSREAPREEVVA